MSVLSFLESNLLLFKHYLLGYKHYILGFYFVFVNIFSFCQELTAHFQRETRSASYTYF